PISGLALAKPGMQLTPKLYHYTYTTLFRSGVVSSDGPVAVSADGDYSTPTGASPEAGTYYWVASYSGDANNAPAASGCEDEPVTVNKARSDERRAGNEGTATGGPSFKDKDTNSDLAGTKPGGELTGKLYDNMECKSAAGGVVSAGGPVVGSADGDYSTPTGASPEAGTYYWVASYSGDANNAPAASGCEDEPVTVNKA